MFQDEGRFGLLGTPRRCWAPHGLRPVVGARLERKYIYAFSAVSPHDGVMDSLVLPWVNAETMSMFLAEVALRHADEFVLMVMDQAGWHIAGELVVPHNMRLMLLPPYSPELNPAEHLWEALREDCFANHVFKDLDHVEHTLTKVSVSLQAVIFDLSIGTSDPFNVSPRTCWPHRMRRTTPSDRAFRSGTRAPHLGSQVVTA